jgi:hypothetical protein
VPALNLAVCGDPSPNLDVTAFFLIGILLIFGSRDNPQVTTRNYTSRRNLNDCAPGLPITGPKPYTLQTIGPFLTGLIEGDGTIIVPSTKRAPSGKLNYPSVQISFAAKDIPVAVITVSLLGYGSISKRKAQAAYVLTFNSSAGLALLIKLTDGYYRTPKYYDFVALCSWYSLKAKPMSLSCLLSDA